MKRLASLFLAAVLAVLCGCRSSQPQVAQEVLLNTNENRQETKELTFVVDTRLGGIYEVAANHFAQNVNELSGGELTVNVDKQRGAGALFAAGSAQFSFLDSRMDSDRCDYFAAVSMPFLYMDYQSFTMTINSPQVLAMLGADMGERFGAHPLAGYYRPGNQLITTWQTLDYRRFEDAIIAVGPESTAVMGLNALGANTQVTQGPAERAEWVGQEIADGAELSLEEIASADWLEGDYYVTMTYHDLSPVWLMVKDKLFASLTDRQRAAIIEACAYMYSDVDDVYMQREETLRQQLSGKDFLFTEDFVSARLTLLSALEAMPDSTIGDTENYMLDLMQDFRR